MRKTKIVATIGPACWKEDKLKAVISAGADVIRINASHTNPAQLRKLILFVRRVSAAMEKDIAIMVDLQGPRVRTGKLKDHKPVELRKDEEIMISVGNQEGSGKKISTPCRPFSKMLHKNDPILLDNGAIELKTLHITKTLIRCRVVSGGILGENKGINLPKAPITLPALTQKDLADLEVAAKENVDYVALSFVRTEEDVYQIKNWLKKRRKNISVIAKIEKPGAVKRVGKIFIAAGGVMIARGDLGIEMGVEKIPAVQKDLIEKANQLSIPVITATQMLESMIEHPYPTRAEASDIANAVFDGTDAVMLSGETAIGKHPVEAVRIMSEIIRESERHLGDIQAVQLLHMTSKSKDLPIHAITHAARHAAKDLRAKAILVFTVTGRTAALISKFRPTAPIIAFTDSSAASRKLNLFRGIFPLKIRYGKSTDAMIREADKAISSRFPFLKLGSPVVVVSGRQALPGARYMTKIHHIGES